MADWSFGPYGKCRLEPRAGVCLAAAMKLFTPVLMLGLALLAPAVFASDSFEGRMTIAVTGSKGDAHVLKYATKGTLIRIDPGEGPVSMIMDYTKGEMIMLMHEQQMYMVHKLNDHKRPVSTEGSDPDHEAHDVDVQDTGKTDTILGYRCNQFLVRDGDKTTEIWIAHGLGFFGGLGAPGGGGFMGRPRSSEKAAKWEKIFKGKEGFPLRVITHDSDSKEVSRMEVTKIEKGGVSAADFAPPPEYKAFSMPDLGGLNPFRQN